MSPMRWAGTATAGSDYSRRSGTVSFAIGQAIAEIHIAITPDATVEFNESVTRRRLRAPAETGFINPAAFIAIGLIDNDDGSTRDFNGDGKADILLQNDDGTPGDLVHGRHQDHWRRCPSQSWAYVACRCSGRFQR